MVLDGKAIKLKRHELAWSQGELGSKAGVELRTIQRAEAGESVASHTAALIAQGLGVPIDFLLHSDGDGLVDLVEMQSGKAFLEALRSNHFVEVEYDFEATPKYLDSLISLGDFIDKNWIDPHKKKREMMFEFIDRGGMKDEFERHVMANEVLTQLKGAGLNLLYASYTAHRDRMVYDEKGNWEPRLDQGSARYRVALIAITSGKKMLRKKPEDHVDVRDPWPMAPYAKTMI